MNATQYQAWRAAAAGTIDADALSIIDRAYRGVATKGITKPYGVSRDGRRHTMPIGRGAPETPAHGSGTAHTDPRDHTHQHNSLTHAHPHSHPDGAHSHDGHQHSAEEAESLFAADDGAGAPATERDKHAARRRLRFRKQIELAVRAAFQSAGWLCWDCGDGVNEASKQVAVCSDCAEEAR